MGKFQLASEEEIEEFKVEANELLEEAEKCILEIDQGKPFLSNFDAVFRAFHSLKGVAGMLGWSALQEHMHHMENHFQQCKVLPTLDKDQIHYFLKGIDVGRDLLGGKNVEFKVAFPGVKNEGLKPGHLPENVVAETFHATAFVIDDEPDLVEILKEFLEFAGFDVEGFTDAKAALERLNQRRPDIVLTDMKMPELSGMAILAAVNKVDPELPVIFVSGQLTKEMVIEAVSYGIFGVIEKPFSESQIVSVSYSAAMRSHYVKLLNRSINFIMYQYSDLDEYMREKGKKEIREMMNEDLKALLDTRRRFRALKIKTR